MVRFLILLLLSSNLLASNQMVLKTEFYNQTWYPLPKEDMRAAAVDSFISQVAQSHSFKLVPVKERRARQAGEIDINVSLVEKAEIIKISVNWTSYKGPTHSSTQSLSLHGKSYDEIYNTMELVGRKAGRDITQQISGKKYKSSIETEKFDQILNNQKDITTALKELKNAQDPYTDLLDLKVHYTVASNQQRVSLEFDLVSKRQLDLAARLKREEKFEQAYATLRSLEARPNLNDELKNAVQEELYFALPVHQADIEFTDVGMNSQAYQRDGSLWSRIDAVQSRLQNALSSNEKSIQKSGEINRRLDQIALNSKYMRGAFRAQAISQISGFRFHIMEVYVSEGRYPEPAELKSGTNNFEGTIEKTLDTGDKAAYTFITEYGEEIKLLAHRERVELQR